MVSVAAGTREQLVVTGSRSREEAYSAAIETAVAQHPDLVHYRVQYGPPRHRALADVVGRSVREDLEQATRARTASVVELAQELIRHPSRAGIDDHGPVLGVLEDWLAVRPLPHRRLHDDAGHLVGCSWRSPGRPGPWRTLDACVDTAPYGDDTAWSFPPASGDIVEALRELATGCDNTDVKSKRA
ncbi:hypothetical protein AB0C96_27790 [Streptomyces sp. NPDC048506]|uniref:hypothetical protein n=1 Tax=Streptomyces sp. NPDC048506 TaxID=3155028 RepID=UPI003419500D